MYLARVIQYEYGAMNGQVDALQLLSTNVQHS